MSEPLTPELNDLYSRWLAAVPPECKPHFYNLDHCQRIVFLMVRPLEREISGARHDALAYVKDCRTVFADWLSVKEDFWRELGKVVSPILGRHLTCSADLLDNAYFTDSLKCDGQVGTARSHRDHNDSFLSEELALLKSSEIFITVGNPAWDTLRRMLGTFKAVPWNYQHMTYHPSPTMNLTGIHGVLFQSQKSGKYAIPLTFPPGGNNNPLRNSYLEYLRDGVAAFNSAVKI